MSLKLLDKRFSIESCSNVIWWTWGTHKKNHLASFLPTPTSQKSRKFLLWLPMKASVSINKFSIPNLGVFCLESYFCQRKINITVGKFHKTFWKKVFPLQVHVFTTCKLMTTLMRKMIRDAHPAILPLSTKSTGVAQDKSHGRCG